MPRQSRIDIPGALHHIIVRGIEGRRIFRDNTDRSRFLDRLGNIIEETDTRCLAWALLPNHFHLLLKTSSIPISTVMSRLLTGYAVTFNRRHRRHGHLFQNRYKSILCQEDTYLKELVRYIHLNPLRARLVEDLASLGRYLYAGHFSLVSKKPYLWQDTDSVLAYFGKTVSVARRRYREFIREGVDQGRRPELTGGGLIRSAGGWSAVRALRKSGSFQNSDERILGDGDFVDHVLREAEEKLERSYALAAQGMDFDGLMVVVADLMSVSVENIVVPGKARHLVKARSVLSCWAVRELGLSMTWLAKRLSLSVAAVSLSVKRGEKVIRDEGLSFPDV